MTQQSNPLQLIQSLDHYQLVILARAVDIGATAIALTLFCAMAIAPRLSHKLAAGLTGSAVGVVAAGAHVQWRRSQRKSMAISTAADNGFDQQMVKAFMPMDARPVKEQQHPPALEAEVIEEEFSEFELKLLAASESADPTAKAIARTLAAHGALVCPVGKQDGLAFDRYLFEPDSGVSVATIEKMGRDLMVRVGLSALPVIQAVPGAIAIDVPKKARQFVSYADVVPLHPSGNNPVMTIGIDHVTRELIEVEFCSSSMENYVLGGLPRQGGKTSLIYSMMASLARTPDLIRFVIFDGKGGVSYPFILGHRLLMRSPELDFDIAVDTDQGTALITQIKAHVDKRYELFRKTGVSHLDAYNEITDKKMPYIFVIVDECQGVIDPKGEALKTWEKTLSICNAAGVGFVFATQRVDSNVIPEQINKKCASRICLLVQSDKDSKYVLNDLDVGARLLGKGDMAYRPGGAAPLRLQSPYLSLPDVSAIFEAI